MSKNLTRMGLAFAAISSLVATVFAALPASAAGINNGSVSLAPNTGSNYAVLLGQNFALKSNSANVATGSGKYLKFLVEDANAAVTAVTDSSSAYTATVAAGDDLMAIDHDLAGNADDADEVSVVFGAATKFKVGDKIEVNGFHPDKDGANGEILDGTIHTVSKVSADKLTVSFLVPAAAFAADLALAASAEGVDYDSAALSFTVVASYGSARGALTSFVFDTKSDTNTSDKVLALTTASTTTKSATVTAWIDDNDNGKIDTTEYSSPARTVQFVLISDLTPSVVLSPVTTGDTALTATMTTTPALNGEQVGNTKVGTVFTRQDSAAEIATLATWNEDTEQWDSSLSLDTGNIADNTTVVLYDTTTVGNWGFTAPDARAGVDNAGGDATDPIQDVAVSTAGVVTVTTLDNHNLRAGDKVTMTVDAADTTIAIAAEATAAVTVTGPKTFTYAVSETTLPTAALSDTSLEGGTGYTVQTYGAGVGMVKRAFPGTHTARFAAIPKANIAETTPKFLDKVGAAVGSSSAARTAASLSVDAVEGATAGKTGADTTDILNGTKTASVTVTVLTSTGAAAAGKAVKATVNAAPTGAGDFTLNSLVAVNGTAAYVTTNAAGQATFTVTNSLAAIGDAIALQFTTEGLTAVSETLTWNDAQYRIVDLNDTSEQSVGIRDRYAVTGGSYTFDLMVMDQYRNAAPAGFGLLAAVTERAVSTSYIELTSGRASVTVTDGGLGASAFANVDLRIVKKVAGVWTTPADADVVDWSGAYNAGAVTLDGTEQRDVHVNFATQTDKITLNANGASTPNTATAADLAATVATVALTEADLRLVGSAAPSYAAANKGVVSGSVANSVTGVANKGAVVTATLAGALFKVGNVWKKDSISFLTDTNGFFAVDVYSSSAGSKTVTISSGNATAATAAVVYTGIAGTAALTITAPAAVKPASTFQVKAKLADAAGNVVDTAAGRVKVTYTGPGIIFGTLPTETDANGELSFSVLLGSNDTGSVSVAISYDANADADFIDATDLTSSATIAINATGTLTEQKVNAGSFKGYVALYAKGYAGQRMSAKVGKDWVVVESLASNFERVVEFTGAGYTVAVRIYIDRVLIDTITVTTK